MVFGNMEKECRILILEDNPSDSELMEIELRKGGVSFSALRVDEAAAFERALGDFNPDVILADYALQSFNGLLALALVRERRPDVPFIIVSGTMGKDFAAETVKGGATDYVAKDDLSKLAPAVKRALTRAGREGLSVTADVSPVCPRVEPGDEEKRKILIIDDDQNIRKTLSDILKVKGYDTLTAGSGGEGISLLNRGFVNVAVIDLKLPDMSGTDVLNKVKELSPSTEAIILTGSATLDSAIEATNRGAFSFLLKPYDIDNLVLSLKRAVDKQQSEGRIVRQAAELRRINSEIKALYETSQSLSSTIDLDRLLPAILDTVMGISSLCVERKGCIFLVEKEEVRLISCVGLSQEKMTRCHRLRKGECLCGLAAATGEIIVSRNCDLDKRHTNRYDGMTSHGHIILPLKEVDRTVGVLCLYLNSDVEIDIGALHLLFSLGSQIGIAIGNAERYEEAKATSLHDSLTRLGNRRLLQVQMGKWFEAAKRYSEKLSVIMLDIDHFKRYNDTFGHPGGGPIAHAHRGDTFERGEELRLCLQIRRRGVPRTAAGHRSPEGPRGRRKAEGCDRVGD